jgi:hypothetical protein
MTIDPAISSIRGSSTENSRLPHAAILLDVESSPPDRMALHSIKPTLTGHISRHG